MSFTELNDTADKVRREIYNSWKRNLTFGNYSKTMSATGSSYCNILDEQTVLSVNLNPIYTAARIWKILDRKILSKNKPILIGRISPTAYECAFDSFHFSQNPNYSQNLPFLEEEIENFCKQKDIISDVNVYYELIFKIFQNIKEVKIILQPDYEIKDYKMVRFDIILSDEMDNILTKKREFDKEVCKIISKNARIYFVLTFNIA
ncbi:MAG: hypothetical protein FJ264_15030 [Planctomycetes bacterium]|nr:hypothetical protein [Planctomycetota bacterium]